MNYDNKTKIKYFFLHSEMSMNREIGTREYMYIDNKNNCNGGCRRAYIFCSTWVTCRFVPITTATVLWYTGTSYLGS